MNGNVCPTRRVVRVFLAFVLLAAWFQLLPSLVVRWTEASKGLSSNFKRLFGMTAEERRISDYGDLDKIGYGYLRRIVEKVPDPEFFPTVRYPQYYLNAHILYPGMRRQIDRRILVGIDLSEPDVKENPVAQAKRISLKEEQGTSKSVWLFLTTFEYDLMTGIRLNFEEPFSNPPQQVQIFLFHSPQDQTELGRWSWENVILGDSVQLHLDDPVKKFSFMRGSMPFVLAIEVTAAEPAAVAGVEVLGVKVDMSGYSVVHSEGGCFTAFQKSLLADAVQNEESPWRKVLEEISKTGPRTDGML